MRSIVSCLRGVVALVGAIFGLGQHMPVRAATSWSANDDDAVLFDVRLGQWRLGDGVRGYQTPQGPCVDLADTIMALDIPVRLDTKLRRATGWAFTEKNSLLIDREANTVQTMNSKQKLATGQVYDTPEGWCVNTLALAEWLGVKMEADTGNALLIVKSSSKLPVELAAERRSRAAKIRPITSFDLKTLPQARVVNTGFKTPALDAVITLSAGRNAKGGISPEARYELYASGEAGPVAYDARVASSRKGVPNSLRLRAYRIDPDGRALGRSLPVTQVAIGDVGGFSTPIASQANIGRGAMISNRPVDQPEGFDQTSFRGELPAGWDAELYRNGQLMSLAMDRTDGRYEFLNVPLLYGQNRFEIILYGPQGQTRRDEKTVMVGYGSVQPRKTWYWGGINQDGRDLVGLGERTIGTGGWRGTIGVEHGFSARTSASFALSSISFREVGRRNFAEAAVRQALGPTLIELSSATDFGSGAALRAHMLGQFGSTYITADSLSGFGGFVSDRLTSGVNGRHSVAVDRNVTLGRTIVPLHFDAEYLTRRNGPSMLDISARASANVGRLTLTGEAEWRRDRDPSGQGSHDSFETAILGNARIGRVRLRGEGRFRLAPEKRFESSNLIAEWSGTGDQDRQAGYRAELGYDRSLDRARFGFGYSRRFEKFSLTGSAEAGTDGSFSFGLSLSFSLGADPRHPGRVRVSSSHQAALGQILARVYRDVNGDGKRQNDEPFEKDVQLTAGRVPVHKLTDKNGAVIIEDAQPYTPMLVGIDASSLPDPLIQPTGPGFVVSARPGVTAIVDLPLVGTGEIDGTLIQSGGNGIEGVDLELVDSSGVVVKQTRSDFDGYFLFDTVPYGKYSLRLSKTSAEITGLRSAIGQTLTISNDNASAHMGNVSAEAIGPKVATGP